MWWYWITRSGKWSLNKYSPASFLCDLCHNIYHKVVFRLDMFSPDYMWNSKVKIWVWARLVKRDDLSVSTSQWSPHVSQCMRNNWVTRGRHTLVYFTAQTPLRMHKTPPDVTLAGAWNNLKPHRDCCHYTGHSYIGLHYQDCCRYTPCHHQPPSWLEYGYDCATDMLQPLNKECSREVVRSLTPNRHPICREITLASKTAIVRQRKNNMEYERYRE